MKICYPSEFDEKVGFAKYKCEFISKGKRLIASTDNFEAYRKFMYKLSRSKTATIAICSPYQGL